MPDLSFLGPSAAVVVVVIIFLRFMQSTETTRGARDEKFAEALVQNTQAMQEMANATKKSADEAEKRNGHLAELSITNKKSSDKNSKAILGAIKTLKVQHVETQTVSEQVVTKTKSK